MPKETDPLKPKQRERIYLATGSAHPELAEDIAAEMGITLGGVALKQFPNTELHARYEDSVRGKEVFIIQSLAPSGGRSVSDAIVEAMIMVDAAKRASASEITLVAPYLAYSRQDRKAQGREPISVALFLKLLGAAGVNRMVSADLHAQQIQGMFDGPYDHLVMEPALEERIKEYTRGHEDEYVMVAPDEGRIKADSKFAKQLGINMVSIPKSRNPKDPSKISRPKKVKGVKGKHTILADDMIDTAGTIVSAAQTLKDSGAKTITIATTHAIFSDPAAERLDAAPIDRIIVTDTIPVNEAREVLGERLEVVRCAPLIAKALVEIATRGSVSEIFHGRNAA